MRGAHHVADDAADAGVGAAERLDRRRVVVGLGLHRDGRAAAERDDAGVADERAAHERRVDRVGGASRSCSSSGVTDDPSSTVIEGAERLVRAVLAPRLGECLQLDVGRRTTCRSEVVGDDVQLGEVERQPALAVERREGVVIEPVDLDQLDTGVGGCRSIDERRLDRADGPSLDDLVGEQAAGEDRHGHVVDVAVHFVPRAGGDGIER